MDTNGGEQQFNYTAANQPQTTTQPAKVAQQPREKTPAIQWNASEFIDHQKSAAWIFPLAGIAVLASVIIYFLTRNILSSVVLLAAGLAFGVLAYQKPRTMSYTLLPTSMKVGDKVYSYDDFRTFSIMQEGGLYSIFLEPVRRFMPPLTIYFDPNDGEEIFDLLASHIPHQEKAPDAIDRFMQRIRF